MNKLYTYILCTRTKLTDYLSLAKSAETQKHRCIFGAAKNWRQHPGYCHSKTSWLWFRSCSVCPTPVRFGTPSSSAFGTSRPPPRPQQDKKHANTRQPTFSFFHVETVESGFDTPPRLRPQSSPDRPTHSSPNLDRQRVHSKRTILTAPKQVRQTEPDSDRC